MKGLLKGGWVGMETRLYHSISLGVIVTPLEMGNGKRLDCGIGLKLIV